MLKIVNLLAAEVDSSGQQALAGIDGHIYVPDTRSVLITRSECLYNDAPWLHGRVDPARMRTAHPKVQNDVIKESYLNACTAASSTTTM